MTAQPDTAPAGFTPDVESWDGVTRCLWAAPRSVSGRPDVTVTPVLTQLADGSIAVDQHDPPGAYVDIRTDCPLTVFDLCQLAMLMSTVAAEIAAAVTASKSVRGE